MNFFRKTLFVSLLVLSIFGFANKSYAFLGIGDVVLDPANLTQNIINAFSNPVTAFGTTPVTAVASVGHLVKDTGLDAIAWQVGRSILKGITAQTVNWINSGFKGKPAFLTNPEKFFQNQADLQLERILGNDLNLLCQPFAIQVRLALVKTYLQEARPPANALSK